MPDALPPVPVQTDVAIVEPDSLQVSDSKFDDLAKSLGLVGIPAGMLSKLRDLGAAVEEAGVVRVSHGKAMLSMMAVTKAIVKLGEILDKEDVSPRTVQDTGRALGYLMGQITRSSKAMAEIADLKDNAPPTPAQKSASWKPGSVVGPSVNVHVAAGASITVQEGQNHPQIPSEAEKPA